MDLTWLRVAPILALLGALPLLGGCAPPTQYGGPIAVDQAGLRLRLTILCRMQTGHDAARRACQPDPPSTLPQAGESASPVAQTASGQPSP